MIKSKIELPVLLEQLNSSTFRGKMGDLSANKTQFADFNSYLEKFEMRWRNSRNTRDRLVSNAPSGVRPLIEAQIAVGRMELQIHLISKAGEAAGSTLRKIQQMGAG